MENLEGILQAANGVMVARGDLGLEMPLEQIPRVQKGIIRRSRAAGLPVILATQVLESMRGEPRPTRAEVSDAANAVDEGADAIMLAGETASGQFPVRAVQMLDAIIRDAELLLPGPGVPLDADPTGHHGRALCEAAVTLASAGEADVIVAVTREGTTARLLASLRPPTPIVAATPAADVASACALSWGVAPLLTEALQDGHQPGGFSDALERVLLERGLIQRGALVVFVNVSAELKRTDANFINLQCVG